MSSDFRLGPIVMHDIGNLDGKRFLDVACGLGRWGYAIKLGWSGRPQYVVGVDIWRPHLEFVTYHKIYDDVVLADARFLPFADKSFNVASACEVLLHFGRHEGVSFLKEIERVSSQRVVVSVPNRDMTFGEDPENPFEKNISRWSASDFDRLGYKVRGVGFQMRGRRISSFVLSGLTYLSLLNRFAELIVAKKDLSTSNEESHIEDGTRHHHNKASGKVERSAVLVAFVSLVWLLLRTGTKPSRITYPCQRAALANVSLLSQILIPASVFTTLGRVGRFATSGKARAIGLVILVLAGASLIFSNVEQVKSEETQVYLNLSPRSATVSPASDIFAVNYGLNNVTGETADEAVGDLITLMGSHELLFYKSQTSGANKGPNGLIASDDVIIIKINCQWPRRGGTNTDLLKALIQKIVEHPDGFVGEIVVADNGQGVGSMDWDGTWLGRSNAEDRHQSTQDVVDMFSGTYNVSTYSWQDIMGVETTEYSTGNMADGYVVNHTANPRTGIETSYPKFRTNFGTYISLKEGIWNGSGYEDRLKIINLPVLKSHGNYGVTACVKSFMGVPSEGEYRSGGVANGHNTVGMGGMGTLMVETRFPVLNILDAIWVNANPYPSSGYGPITDYDEATRLNIIMASTDPVALDYWAAKCVLMPAAQLIGYSESEAASMDPDNPQRVGGLREAFGVWLNRSRDEINRRGYQATTNEEQMNVYVLASRHELNLRIMDWDLTDPIEGAYVYSDEEVKVSDANGWANWTGVGGTVMIKVRYFGQWVNGTFSICVDTDKTITVRSNIFDITVTCVEGFQGAILQDANVTVFNSTSISDNRLCTTSTDASGKAKFSNVPNGTLTFTVYDGRGSSIIANVSRIILREEQQETVVCDQNCVTSQLEWKMLVKSICDYSSNRSNQSKNSVSHID